MSRRPIAALLKHKLGHDEIWAHLQTTPLELPAYSAPALPFRWLNRDGAEAMAKILPIGYEPEIEPRDRWMESSSWVLNPLNQRHCLDAFWSAVKPKSSLCFFYAKGVPHVEDGSRVLVGVGRVLDLLPLRKYINGQSNGYEAWVWERQVMHSIRPGFEDGFVLPYHQLLEATRKDPSIEFSEFLAFAPEDHRAEFSYASEHVTADAALQALERCRRAIEKATEVIPGSNWPSVLKWINDRQSEVLRQRGPYPGLGAVLTALGVQQGMAIAADIVRDLPPDRDPWPLIIAAIASPTSLPAELRTYITPAVSDKFARLQKPDREKRWQFLRLLSRFALSVDQADLLWHAERRSAAGLQCSDADFLSNPYLIYELCRQPARIITIILGEGEDDDKSKVEIIDPISFRTVDRGKFLPAAFAANHPLWKTAAMSGPEDKRRVRAFIASLLSSAEREGHSMLPQSMLLQRARAIPLDPPCSLDSDLLDTQTDFLEGQLVFHTLGDQSSGIQLCEREDASHIIRNMLIRATRENNLPSGLDWRAILDRCLPPVTGTQDESARQEKALALGQLARSRFSVLVGPAGTGKTTLLSALCSEPSIRDRGVLLLAPTGKARVRLQKNAGMPAQTVAQFLLRFGRFLPETGRYVLAAGETEAGYKTVIVDEASMLTEDQLAALIETIGSADRIVLVGDPGQLPPIGVGRPFVDMVKALEPTGSVAINRVQAGYAELTVRMRQADDGEDMDVADLFSGRAQQPGDDEVIFDLEAVPDRKRLKCIRWEDATGLEGLLRDALVEEFSSDRSIESLPASLGAVKSEKGHWHFNAGSERRCEDWQVLSPVRMSAGGTDPLNRLLQRWLRGSMLAYAASMQTVHFRVPRPCGPQQVVYGDKVINLSNRSHRYVYPKTGALRYIANGEIGVVIGETFSGPKRPDQSWFPKRLNIAFGSQPGFTYSFLASAFREEGEADVELAYAITVHKSQGSEFDKTLVVVPAEARTLCRELLYTALTRHRHKLIILHQGPIRDLLRFRAAKASAIARRFTTINIRAEKEKRPIPVEIVDPATGRRDFFESYLIHRTRSGLLVSSKSEVIVGYELEIARQRHLLTYAHEQPIDPKATGRSRWPDFIVNVAASGRTFYWEHCGMLRVDRYRKRWERKVRWYEQQGITRWDSVTNPEGQLVVTEDEPNGSIDAAHIKEVVERICMA